jgi:hypothetical protein
MNTSRKPLNNAAYLASPVNTLVHSVRRDTASAVSVHDLLDAYGTLHVRLSSQVAHVADDAETPCALEVLRREASALVDALRRDMARAREEPSFDATSPVASGSGLTSVELAFMLVRDSVALCHASLQFLSDVFQYPLVHALFHGEFPLTGMSSCPHLSTRVLTESPARKCTVLSPHSRALYTVQQENILAACLGYLQAATA